MHEAIGDPSILPKRHVDDKVPLSEWFDPKNVSHLKALCTWMNSGRWPQFFLPADVKCDSLEIEKVMKKVVAQYIEEKTKPATRADFANLGRGGPAFDDHQ